MPERTTQTLGTGSKISFNLCWSHQLPLVFQTLWQYMVKSSCWWNFRSGTQTVTGGHIFHIGLYYPTLLPSYFLWNSRSRSDPSTQLSRRRRGGRFRVLAPSFPIRRSALLVKVGTVGNGYNEIINQWKYFEKRLYFKIVPWTLQRQCSGYNEIINHKQYFDKWLYFRTMFLEQCSTNAVKSRHVLTKVRVGTEDTQENRVHIIKLWCQENLNLDFQPNLL